MLAERSPRAVRSSLFALAAMTLGACTGSTESEPTYYADVKPILATHCTRCHQDGGLGMGDFRDLETVRQLAPLLSWAVSSGRMPAPAADPACRDYVGSDALSLSDEERDVLLTWLDGDQPLGDPADDPEVVEVSPELSDPDLVLSIDQPYTPTFSDPEHPGNEYRCFVLDKPEDVGAFYITAMAPEIDALALAHHAVLFMVDDDTLASTYAEGFADGTGTPCFDDGNTVQGMITAWAPGMQPIAFPDGAGLLVPEDRTIILQMHYHGTTGEGLSDQTRYAFRTTDAVDTNVFMVPAGSDTFEIPAGDDDHTHTATFPNPLADLTIYGTFPHMHELGQRYAAEVVHEDGTESCFVRGDYEFDNQMTYQFSEPVTLARGETLQLHCNWNNSTSNPDLPYDEPRTTTFGENTDEEMCFFFTYGSF
jgi:mono/diheme cytochrome c family protein